MKYKKHKLENITRSQIIHIIDENVIGFKAERNRKLLKRRLCDGLTFEELAEEFDMSVRHVKRIVYNLECDLLNHLRVEE